MMAKGYIIEKMGGEIARNLDVGCIFTVLQGAPHTWLSGDSQTGEHRYIPTRLKSFRRVTWLPMNYPYL
jgi:hypothetical protein